MRILFLNHNTANRGGTFYRAFDVARHLASRGHSVTLLTISDRARWGFSTERRQGIDVVYTPDLFWGVGRTGWDPWDTLNRIGYVRRGDWDIVHAWDTRPVVSLPALVARRRSRGQARLVIDWCDWWGRGGTQVERAKSWMRLVAPVETFFEERFRPYADGTTVISDSLAQRAVDLGVPRSTIRILPQGCDGSHAADGVSPEDRGGARRRLGVSPPAPLAVAVGALNRSDAALLFDALRLLFARRPDCRFALIGRHGAHVPDDLRQSDCLIETGYVPDAVLRDYMIACDALVTALADTTASRARWPSKVNPFLALGRATVITAVGDLPRLLAAEGAAVVTAPEPAAIADGVLALFDDPQRRSDIERRARTLAQGKLAWPALVADLEQFYVSLHSEAR